MGKSLVIVESPAKAKTINKYLGNDFIVKSSVGHIRDLPTKALQKAPAKPAAEVRKMSPEEKAAYKQQRDYQNLVMRMGIDPEHGWEPHYEVLPGKEKVVKELKSLAKKADKVYLATDLDREGEAIAWHLRELIGGEDENFQRVVFNEITQKAIKSAFAEPANLNISRVNAQQTRRFLDRVVGFMLSPLLWKKIARGLSAGRVQSVAVRLVVEREREIKAFNPEEYWDVHADLAAKQGQAVFQVAKENGKTFKPKSKQETELALSALKDERYEVVKREDKPTSSRPGAPFITSTLQQAASTRLGFGVKKTMMMAQRLYEAGYITYMRTDSTHLSQDAIQACRQLIEKDFGAKYLPEKPNFYGSKANAQEAHEAIRPSNASIRSNQLKGMERDAERLYELIWRQFVACQMTPAQYDSTSLTVQAGNFELKARGRVLRFDGWTKVQPQVQKKGAEDASLPDIQQGEVLALQALNPQQHFTKPPARFSEASLVKELEKRGIGRPSTYASIISTIQDRGYVRVENRRFYAEKMGEIVTDRLTENFANLMSYDFTAQMEQRLDDIADGEQDWKRALDEFYAQFKERLETAGSEEASGGMRSNVAVPTDVDCPKCGRKMGIRTASTGVFLGCSGYNLEGEDKCTQTLNLLPGDEAVKIEEGDEDSEAEAVALLARKRCSKCGTAMDSYLIDEKRKLHVCGNNPVCDGVEIEQGSFRIKGYDGPIIDCDKCGSQMQLKSGRFGKYFGCTNDDCKNTRKLLKNGEPAPPKEDPVPLPELPCENSDAYFVLRDGASGIFMSANTFPRSRETRAVKVSELKRFKDRLPKKFYYLAEAPAEDSKGNEAIVRYSRKTKSQYVMSEEGGKATGWQAHYENGEWKEVEGKSSSTTRKRAASKKGSRSKKS
ncbi:MULTISPECIES: type I DNA topoisomerase [Gammaproteobacteria]|uniref:type I DNA topoisomerase n=1 Tax=Gammaproteobacteria TaxID=1236 RepID=UPI000DCFFB87|nr:MULTISPECIES: type I DNA topoisomerase [Gammaproteobacteria]RTE86871.1 type I DNA topoisomerase [Aliidiomarina sp. B3213]TCZ93340.1 type I DNA topoisomerase [Lysobacter sp. N42]